MNLPQLTSTRFFAAFAIVVFHFGVFGEPVAPFHLPFLKAVFSHANVGVSYFFVLSGFIMTLVYHQPGTPTRLDKRRYWVARFARIYPLYALALVLAIFQPLLPPSEGLSDLLRMGASSVRTALGAAPNYFATHSPLAVLLNFTLLQAWVFGYAQTVNAPGWSLSVEAFFYLLFPFLLPVLQRLSLRQLSTTVLIIWVFTVIFQVGAVSPFDTRILFPPLNLSSFLVGMATAVAFRVLPPATAKRWGWGLGGLAAGVVALVAVRWDALEFYLNAGLLAPVFAWLVWAFARSRGVVVRVLSWPPLVLLGEVSYGVYILQMPVNLYLTRVFDRLGFSTDPTVRFYAYAAGLILISTAAYFFIEKPLRAWINQRLGRRSKAPAPVRA